MPATWTRLTVTALVGALYGSCSTPGTGPRDAVEPCRFESCSAECAVAGQSYESCSGGRCHCTGEEADAGGDDVAARDGAGDETGSADDAGDSDRGVPDCTRVAPSETCDGASPGVICTRISTTDVEGTLLGYDGDARSVVLVGSPRSPQPLWLFDRASGRFSVLDDLSDTGQPYSYATQASLDGARVAYTVQSANADNTVWTWQVRLIDDRSVAGIHRLLDAAAGARTADREPRMDFVTLDYPWVVWRDIREANRYRWDAFALNIATAEVRNLSLNPVTGERDWGGVLKVDLLGTMAVFDISMGGGSEPVVEDIVMVDLATNVHTQLTNAAGGQTYPTITPHWIAWWDQRNHPDPTCQWPWGCSSDIYGYNRDTGETQALVIAGDSMQGPTVDGEGDWIAYDDQRGGTDVTHYRDREQDIYALHLPTMTEIRVTDWPGFELQPRVANRGGGTYSVLLVQEIDYGRALYRLWDCTLPEPAGG